ncbi:MAG: pyruvate, phosphate dikinase [Bacilli bacterium]|nr:pyruvate, phosphate dikinase [Bacilli bacterium]
MEKYVYLFSEGNKDMRLLLGGKGANLAEMANMGLPVPMGFTITTKVCDRYYKNSQKLDIEVEKQIYTILTKLEEITGKKIGDKNNPLLLSVRSGAPVSMPGMMDTILNLGLNDVIAANLATDENTLRFIYDSYRRLIMMFADVVKGKGREDFEKVLNHRKSIRGVTTDIELSGEDMYEITLDYKKIYKKLVGEDFPQNPKIQLLESIKAVFRSWNTERAKVYRQINNISSTLGTAVNVQEMVYGNLTDNSFTGVAFSRNPSNGIDELYGEYLEKAQGEDIVSGVRTPKSIAAMERDYPDIYKELKDISKLLERHYKDMQDMEFTVENGKLYMLQTRNGKRTTNAALKIAIDLVNENLITKEEAIMRIEPEKLDELLHPSFDKEQLQKAKLITTGLPASPGAVTGSIYFTVDDVLNAKKEGINAILVRVETSAEDIEGMNSAVGILTVRGGMTSHAAVVARGIGKCCICGCHDIQIDNKLKQMKVGNNIYHEGDKISLDGITGNIYEGQIKTEDNVTNDNLNLFLNWAKDIKTLGIKANAETEKDAITALKFGAEGIGLARSEHMFFEEEKLFAMRRVIFAKDKEEREKALEKLLPYQQTDFEKIFRIMAGKKVTIRYLDPPLHEFLPKTKQDIELLAKKLNVSEEHISNQIDDLKELNPMMGHRGCRLLITYPEIAIMQTKAIIGAAIKISDEGKTVYPQLMIPLVGSETEFNYLKEIIDKTAKDLIKDSQIDYEVGSMLEVPRSVVIADKLATNSKFFSFGTNDLTQMTYGFSRDDAGKFLADYYDKGVFKTDPFKTIDQDGVGRLLTVGTKLAKKTNPKVEIGICGEHGGDPKSIEFCHNIGLTYVSCSPYRIPIAILSAAQAKVKESGK